VEEVQADNRGPPLSGIRRQDQRTPSACTCARDGHGQGCSTGRARSTSAQAHREGRAERFYKASLPEPPSSSREILKIYESAKKDTRVIKEMIDLAMPDD